MCLSDINAANLNSYTFAVSRIVSLVQSSKSILLFPFFSYYKNQESRNLFSSLAPFILSQDHDLGNPVTWLNTVQSSLQKASAIRTTQCMFSLKIKMIKFQTARTETKYHGPRPFISWTQILIPLDFDQMKNCVLEDSIKKTLFYLLVNGQNSHRNKET